jgi:DNA-directed RNA polymerase specialized sigma24 family protein
VPTDYDIEVDELGAIAGRDDEAFKRWFIRCESPLRRSLRSFAELVDVEPVVQDAAFKVWQNASKITPDGRPGFLLRWSKTVALNDARSKLRRSGDRPGQRVPLTDEDAFGSTSPTPRDPFLLERIKRCLERLQSHQQRAFLARVSDSGARHDRELATSIDMGFDAFRQNLTRGRKALLKCLASFKIDVAEYLR